MVHDTEHFDWSSEMNAIEKRINKTFGKEVVVISQTESNDCDYFNIQIDGKEHLVEVMDGEVWDFLDGFEAALETIKNYKQ